MKNFLCIFLILFLSCAVHKRDDLTLLTYSAKKINDYQITKIDSINDVYIFYATRNDSVVKIVSLKKSDSNCEKNVSVGNFYVLETESFFLPNFHQKLDIKGFKVNNTIIKLEGNGVVWDLFSSKNLEGLCYVSNQ